MKDTIDHASFEGGMDDTIINQLRALQKAKNFERLNALLPQSWLQRRIWSGSYANLRNIIKQRRHHKLPQWQFFCEEVKRQVDHPEFLPEV